MGRTDWYLRFTPHAAIGASCTAPLRAKYIFTSQRRRFAAPAPIREAISGESETVLALTFQCPGGVSELGPSAQNSATARRKSPWLTTSAAYGLPVDGLSGRPWPSLVPSVLFPYRPGEISSGLPVAASSRALSRITSIA